MGVSSNKATDTAAVTTSVSGTTKSEAGNDTYSCDKGERNTGTIKEPTPSLMVGLTRSLLLGLKSAPKGMLQASLKKRAFMTLGQRTTVSSGVLHKGVTKSDRLWKRISEYVKATVLGMAVFGVYDVLVSRMQLKQNYRHDNSSTDQLVSSHTIDTPIPLWSHFMAGAIAGAVQSGIMSVWEVVTFWESYRHCSKLLQRNIRFGMNHTLVARRLIHHSVGYSTLFGSYEFFRRILSNVHDISTPVTLDGVEWFRIWQTTTIVPNVPISSMGSTFVAGGLSGQLHFVVNHYTMHWKLQALVPMSPQRKRVHEVRSRIHSSWLLLRASGTSFVPTALCFVVFQYGGEMVEHLLHGSNF